MNVKSTTNDTCNNDDYYLQLLHKDKHNSRVFFEKYKQYLSLYFVFYYLYYNTYESINNRLCYNEINDYYKTQYSIEKITQIFDIAYYNKYGNISVKNIYQLYCNKNCNTCINKDLCY